MDEQETQTTMTGRIQEAPAEIVHRTTLHPQFTYEVEYLLPHYLHIEQAMLKEYIRLELMTKDEAHTIHTLLASIQKETLIANPRTNMSDILFAIEEYVYTHYELCPVTWHVDRSRNDVQATAQVMFAREKVQELFTAIIIFADAIQQLATDTRHLPMPGYTHYQSAQIITPGFYLAAINEELQTTLKRLSALAIEINQCPLGAGAMSGLEVAWDRESLAHSLGFQQPIPHALVSIASKSWLLHIAAEISTLSVTLSRFATDLITWGSSGYHIIDLPDHLSGISSAMPQKKNYPILERIRGKTAHSSAYYIDFVMAQKNTPYTNLIETAKEGGSNFLALMENAQTLLILFTTVIQHLRFQEERMYELCSHEFFGGFSLANYLTLHAHIPYRQAQVLAGKYITTMLQQQKLPQEVEHIQLQQLCTQHGYTLSIDQQTLQQLFSVQYSISQKKTSGSTHPQEVLSVLEQQQAERQHLHAFFKKHISTLPTNIQV